MNDKNSFRSMNSNIDGSFRNSDSTTYVLPPGLEYSVMYPQAPQHIAPKERLTAFVQRSSRALFGNKQDSNYVSTHSSAEENGEKRSIVPVQHGESNGSKNPLYVNQQENGKKERSTSFIILAFCCCCIVFISILVFVLYPRNPDIIPDDSLADFSLALEVAELQVAFSGVFQAVVVNNAFFEIKVTDFQALVVFQSIFAPVDMVIPNNGGNVLDAGLKLPPGEPVVAEVVFDADIGIDDLGTGLNLLDACAGNDPLFAVLTDMFVSVEYLGIPVTLGIPSTVVEFKC